MHFRFRCYRNRELPSADDFSSARPRRPITEGGSAYLDGGNYRWSTTSISEASAGGGFGRLLAPPGPGTSRTPETLAFCNWCARPCGVSRPRHIKTPAIIAVFGFAGVPRMCPPCARHVRTRSLLDFWVCPVRTHAGHTAATAQPDTFPSRRRARLVSAFDPKANRASQQRTPGLPPRAPKRPTREPGPRLSPCRPHNRNDFTMPGRAVKCRQAGVRTGSGGRDRLPGGPDPTTHRHRRLRSSRRYRWRPTSAAPGH